MKEEIRFFTCLWSKLDIPYVIAIALFCFTALKLIFNLRFDYYYYYYYYYHYHYDLIIIDSRRFAFRDITVALDGLKCLNVFLATKHLRARYLIVKCNITIIHD